MVRYADDFVCCFEYASDAEAFYSALIKRLQKFELEVEKSKTKVITFGRYASKDGQSKPPTFDFLGFTHYCSTSQSGRFRVKRSEEHTSELQSRGHLVCRLLLEKKKTRK